MLDPRIMEDPQDYTCAEERGQVESGQPSPNSSPLHPLKYWSQLFMTKLLPS